MRTFATRYAITRKASMKTIEPYRILLILLLSYAPVGSAQSISLKIVSINVWSGLDYVGNFSVGEYETPEQREKRFAILIQQLTSLDADVIFIQEGNPIGLYSSRLADALTMDEVHQVCNAGIHTGCIGLPLNLKEGIAILAKPGLQLRELDVWKLSGGFGIYGDYITVHFDESNFALVGKILVGGVPIVLVNAHLSAAPPRRPDLMHYLDTLCCQMTDGKAQFQKISDYWNEGLEKKKEEFTELTNRLQSLSPGVPLIVGGDFNTETDDTLLTNFISECKLHESLSTDRSSGHTWDPTRNRNISFSLRPQDANGGLLTGYDLLSCHYDSSVRQIDYIFLNDCLNRSSVAEQHIVLDSVIDGTQASDHFGVLSRIELNSNNFDTLKETEEFKDFTTTSLEFFPVLMYDTDIGFGYGVKAFFLNHLSLSESFDITLFNSTKGERWYRLAVSLPDAEKRQGKVFPLALDIVFDYDKLIKANYYGLGNDSKSTNLENYTREPIDLYLSLSKGFTTTFVGQIGAKYKRVNTYSFEIGGNLERMMQDAHDPGVFYSSVFGNLRYDTRNSFINPSDGIVVQGECEIARKLDRGGISFNRYSVALQYYRTVWYPRTILATRFYIQNLDGEDIPFQILHSLGGNQTLRGFSQDRIMDKASILVNGELRFPIYARLAGITAIDAGRVFSSLRTINISDWKINPTIGLRYIMDNFVVRLDIGFSNETTGLYFNFGHIF